jgi:2-polyprenyl-6-hydroxyphenyl methylase/3-demethylubiquinone-9 3-methyltransferase
MEVVEHVESLEIFMEETCRKVKKDGLLFLATINRTLYSLFAQKIGAEYILNWLPRGTHDWRRFVKPIELRDLVKKNDFESRNVQGVGANIFKRALHLSDAVSGNYMMACKRV